MVPISFVAHRVMSRSMRALVIDDSADTRDLIVECFALIGIDAIGATDASEALRTLDRVQIDVVLLDLGLPGMSGVEFLRILRASPGIASIPVVIATGRVLQDDADSRFVREKTQGFFLKPYDFEKLCACLRDLVATRKAE